MSRRPVLLIHGFYDTVARFQHIKPYLERRGLRVYSFNLVPNNGDVAVPELARQLDRYVRATFPAYAAIDLVGFSMGGLIARFYMQRLGGIQRVRKLITIGTPHRGTWTAFLRGNPGVRNMRPGSAFLQDLNRDIAMFNAVSFTSIWTPLDLMIVPAHSSRAPVGRSIRVWTPAHPLLARDPRVLSLLLRILTE
jgi:triacylglycerol lipase